MSFITEQIFHDIMEMFCNKIEEDDTNYTSCKYTIIIKDNKYQIVDNFDYEFVGIKRYDFNKEFKKLFNDMCSLDLNYTCEEYDFNDSHVVILEIIFDEIPGVLSEEKSDNSFELNSHLLRD